MKFRITIGRSSKCNLVLADMSVSKIHAEIELLENDTLLLTDCHSTQGTFIICNSGNKEIKQQIISKNDVLKFGRISISVKDILNASEFYKFDKNSSTTEVSDIEISRFSNDNYSYPSNYVNKKNEYTFLFFNLDGRVSRSIYWTRYVIPIFFINIFFTIIDLSNGSSNTDLGIGPYSSIIALLTIVPSISMGVKRCHDRNRTGWFLLLTTIPILNIWVLIELYFLKGTTGNNEYGPDSLFKV